MGGESWRRAQRPRWASKNRGILDEAGTGKGLFSRFIARWGVTEFGLWIADCGLRIVDCGLWDVDWGLAAGMETGRGDDCPLSRKR